MYSTLVFFIKCLHVPCFILLPYFNIRRVAASKHMLALLPRLSRLLSPSSIHHALLSFITSDFAKQAKGIAALKRHQRTTAMAMSASTNLLSILCRVPCFLLCPMIRTRVGVMAMGGRIWSLRQELRVQKRQILPRQAGIGRRDLRWSGRGTVKCMPSAIV